MAGKTGGEIVTAAPAYPVPRTPIAYPALPPQTPLIAPRSYASPLSFVGATRRATEWARRAGGGVPLLGVLTWTAALVLWLPMVYMFIISWYFTIFVVFGPFTFPYRFIRRSQRKSLHLSEVGVATAQTMAFQQQQALMMMEQAARRMPPPPPAG